MPSLLLNPEKDKDFYVYWSTVVDAPVAWGTRSEIERLEASCTPERFDRADKTGTSSHLGWHDRDDTLIYEQRGLLSVVKLEQLCKRIEQDEDVTDLLAPFEHEEALYSDALEIRTL